MIWYYEKLRKELNGCTICFEAIADQMALAVCRSNTAGALMILVSQRLATQDWRALRLEDPTNLERMSASWTTKQVVLATLQNVEGKQSRPSHSIKHSWLMTQKSNRVLRPVFQFFCFPVCPSFRWFWILLGIDSNSDWLQLVSYIIWFMIFWTFESFEYYIYWWIMTRLWWSDYIIRFRFIWFICHMTYY